VRDFFDSFAQEKVFEPLQVENWYGVPLQHLQERKVQKEERHTLTLVKKLQGGAAIVFYHQGMRKALQAAYPELQFTKWQTTTTRQA